MRSKRLGGARKALKPERAPGAQAAQPLLPAEPDLIGDCAIRVEPVLTADQWTHPLTSLDLDPHASGRPPPRSAPPCWILGPEAPGATPFVALWVRRAIAADPLVHHWVREHLDSMVAITDRGRPRTYDELGDLIAAQFAAEGGAELAESVAAEAAEAFAQKLASARRLPKVARTLPNGARIVSPVCEITARSPVVTLVYPVGDGVSSLKVLRDGSLGGLAEVADRLAERYLVPVSEVVACILTGQLPRLSPVRLGERFRHFNVEGVPVTATSRVVLEVDPQLDAAELARTFVHWQKSAGVEPSKSSPKLLPLASRLVDRLRLVPADRLADSGSHPAELFEVGARSWRLVPAMPWSRLARQVDYDPRLIRSRAAAIVHMLLPLDSPREPCWLPSYPLEGRPARAPEPTSRAGVS